MARYAELQATSHFSFLRGASSPEDLFAQAALCGIEALAVCDRNSLAGIVRAHQAAKAGGVRAVVGCRLDLKDGTAMLVYPTDRTAYGRLCRLLTLGKGRAGKAACELHWEDLEACSQGCLAMLIPDEADAECASRLRRLTAVFEDRSYMALTLRRRPRDALRLHDLSNLAICSRVGPVVTNDVLFATPDKRILHDVVTCIREHTTIDDVGFRRERHADRYLKRAEEMARLFARHPEALARSIELAERCTFSLDELRYRYPEESLIPGLSAQQGLEKLTWEAAERVYPEGVPDVVMGKLRHELQLIGAMDYAPYFLTVNAIVQFARRQGILCQGRGSAANSAVCFVLGITSIDPERNDLLFERFVSMERREPPDIDVDFEAGRREEVIQWIYDTYGRDRAAICATVMRFRPKGAVRDVGKVLGLTEDVTSALAAQVWGWSEDGVEEGHAAELNLNLEDRRLRLTLDLARQLLLTPRQLGQHPGGFVLTQDRLDEFVPIEPASMDDRQVIEWDKDDIDALKFMKVDVLGLGMLGCMRIAFELLAKHKDDHLDLASIPAEDARTYRMIRKADTLGTFQIESRAQMAMLPRLKPRTFYDLVIQVAIVRPGPIQGDMVHPYLRRREGLEAVSYPKPELEAVLSKTLGVPLFQEQAMRLAIVCAGFTPGEADQLRRAMATFKFTGGVSHFRAKLIDGMVANGYDPAFAEQTFKQLEGFGSYGFPESHAASFALISYASSWMKCWHPDVFCCALLNAQPMGFYAPAQIVRDAREHGVEVRPPCVNRSRWDSTLEPAGDDETLAVRLGLRLAKGLREDEAAKIVVARADQPYASVEELARRSGASVSALERLADADAFLDGLSLNRRDALWAIKPLRDTALPLFAAADAREGGLKPEVVEPQVTLRPMTEGREVVEDYGHIGLSLRRHPVAFLREELQGNGVVTCAGIERLRDGRRCDVAGLVLVRQKPGSAKGVMFITIEDETGVANLVVWPQLFEKQRRLILSAGMISVEGRIQREGGTTHVIAYKLHDLSAELRGVGGRDGPLSIPRGRGDGATHGAGPDPRTFSPPKAKEIYIPDLRLGSGIKVPTRDFR